MPQRTTAPLPLTVTAPAGARSIPPTDAPAPDSTTFCPLTSAGASSPVGRTETVEAATVMLPSAAIVAATLPGAVGTTAQGT